MKLERVVHTGCRVTLGTAADLLPDIQVMTVEGEPADKVLLFVDEQAGQADAFMFTAEQIQGIGNALITPAIQVAQAMPGNGIPRPRRPVRDNPQA